MNRLCKSLKVHEFWAVAGFAAGLSMMSASALADAAKPNAANAAHGQAIAAQVCVACHAADGNSPAATYPKLAGQHADYLVKQLADFKSQGGKPPARSNPIMSGLAATLSDQDAIDVAAWFASQTTKPGYARDAKTVPLGQRIWRGGIAEKGVPACAACHGPTGQGIPVQYPRLSGQWADYVAAQLNAFQQGTRNNSEPMRQIARRMSDDEIKAVADYAAGLH
ncbi:c-type cytochrome [Paraburkholderia denitrificans]|uniref:C-type cytochrome n=1 Tax=Paraburkholderia denitrificans TaxID=694025 RepID=A0ABW0JE09_9BURK